MRAFKQLLGCWHFCLCFYAAGYLTAMYQDNPNPRWLLGFVVFYAVSNRITDSFFEGGDDEG